MDEMKMILLVEDNPIDEKLTVRALKRNHIVNDIVVVRDGEEALDFLFGPDDTLNKVNCTHLAVILLDMNLPKVSGLDVLRRIRAEEELKTIPVVMLTSSDEEKDIMKSYDLGVNSYVRKPVEFKHFSEAVSQLGVYWLLLNKIPES